MKVYKTFLLILLFAAMTPQMLVSALPVADHRILYTALNALN